MADLVSLEDELSQPLARMEAELSQPPVAPWGGAVVLPHLCLRGHPPEYRKRSGECSRCRTLLNRGSTLPGLTVIWPKRPYLRKKEGRGSTAHDPAAALLSPHWTSGPAPVGARRHRY